MADRGGSPRRAAPGSRGHPVIARHTTAPHPRRCAGASAVWPRYARRRAGVSQGRRERANDDERLRRIRQRQPCRRAAGAMGEIPRPRVSNARQACAMAAGRPHRRLSQGQWRDFPRSLEPQPAAPCAVASRHDLGSDWRTRSAHEASGHRGRLGPAGAAFRHGRDGGRPGAALSDLVRRRLLPSPRPGRRLRARARLQ